MRRKPDASACRLIFATRTVGFDKALENKTPVGPFRRRATNIAMQRKSTFLILSGCAGLAMWLQAGFAARRRISAGACDQYEATG
jgi:hypothetical protein